MGSRRRRRRAREDRHRPEGHEHAREQHQRPVGLALAGASAGDCAERFLGLVARAPGKEHACQQDEHRQREVGHHPAVVERAPHREPAEDRLRDHPQREQRCEPGEVAAVGPPAQRSHPCDPRGDHHGDAQHAVGELDHRVAVQRRVEVAVALRPGRTAEARPRQPHGRAREHDHGERDEAAVGQTGILRWRHRVAVGALAQSAHTRGHRPQGCHWNGSSSAISARWGAEASRSETTSSPLGSGHSIAIWGSS